MSATELSESDVGKAVVRGDDTVGRVVDIESGTAYVDPDPGLTDRIKAELGWSDASGDEDTYPLQEHAVSEVTDDEVRLSERP